LVVGRTAIIAHSPAGAACAALLTLCFVVFWFVLPRSRRLTALLAGAPST
jgi:hypothetical protein